MKNDTIEDVHHDQDSKDTEVIEEEPPSVIESFEMVRKLHLLACTREPELHRFVAALKSKLVDIYIDGSNKKQTSITEYFQKTSL